MGELELCVSIDLYVTETTQARRLRAAGDDVPRARGLPAAVPVAVHDAVHPDRPRRSSSRRGEARQEWEIIEDIASRVGVVPSSVLAARLARQGRAQAVAAAAGRDGAAAQPGRRPLRPQARRPEREEAARGRARRRPRRCTGRPACSRARSATRAGSSHLDPPEIVAAVERLATIEPPSADFPLLLIGLRELRSHNSWMHNSEKLMRGDRVHRARIHPADAEAAGLGEGDAVPDRLPARRGRARRDCSPTRSSAARSPCPTAGAMPAAGRWPTRPAASTSTCSPPPSPRTSSRSPGWRT